jgi:cytochrome c-type biogenesis protein CcmH
VRRATSLAAWAFCAVACTAAVVSAETLDDRAYAVARQLMCPVCVGQTVAESDSTLAREMKTIIREKLAAGETPDQILQFFVGQFGESVLAEPRPGGPALLLYAGPPAALILGLAIAVLSIRRWRSKGAAANQSAPGA